MRCWNYLGNKAWEILRSFQHDMSLRGICCHSSLGLYMFSVFQSSEYQGAVHVWPSSYTYSIVIRVLHNIYPIVINFLYTKFISDSFPRCHTSIADTIYNYIVHGIKPWYMPKCRISASPNKSDLYGFTCHNWYLFRFPLNCHIEYGLYLSSDSQSTQRIEPDLIPPVQGEIHHEKLDQLSTYQHQVLFQNPKSKALLPQINYHSLVSCQ